MQLPSARPAALATNRTLVLVTALAVIVLITAVSTCVVVAKIFAPQDGAIFTTAVIASSAASVNIILSYFVLFTTQKQLAEIRSNSKAERIETAEQLRLAREQLDQARAQASLAEDEGRQARLLAVKGNRENLRARLDGIAPRVTMSRTAAQVRYHSNRDSSSYDTQLPEIEELERSESGSLVFELSWEVRNWGEEPATLMLPEPWSDAYGSYYVLSPDEVLNLTRDFPVYLHADGLRRYAREGWVRPAGAENPWHFTITVSVSNSSYNVQDNLVWSGSMHMFSLNEFGKVVKLSDRIVNDVPVAHRRREYVDEET